MDQLGRQLGLVDTFLVHEHHFVLRKQIDRWDKAHNHVEVLFFSVKAEQEGEVHTRHPNVKNHTRSSHTLEKTIVPIKCKLRHHTFEQTALHKTKRISNTKENDLSSENVVFVVVGLLRKHLAFSNKIFPN